MAHGNPGTMNAVRVGAVVASMILAACATRPADIGPSTALKIVHETLVAEGRDPSEYGRKVEEGNEMGRRCYTVAVWPLVYENPGWEQYFIDPETGQVIGHAYVD
jgi:hypothetical protein